MDITVRKVIKDDAGRPVISYIEDVRNGRPSADLVEVLGPGAADLIMRRMRGWSVVGSERLGRELIAAGCVLERHAHLYTRNLTVEPPAAEWPDPGLPVVGHEKVTPEEVFPSWRSAYHPEHPDRQDDHDLADMLAGKVLGPLLPCSGFALDQGRVVAGVLVADWAGQPPLSGPWIIDVFRDPAPSYAGLGSALLRRALALGAEAGLPALGLAVTEGNPARWVYERVGFELVLSSIRVTVPN
ncbi:GNAT family N-acetyltransferase [Rhizohabitans arisaemae]|uniref:GNAT family N-acetyltransferase n=1 Tax=Rhizohabitans arisaemae TaxID=2720610 RepID=UPI0024B20E20|nr:GNAT family N-acetyltransferase [Rhizohabitans arisaemae]